MITIQIRKKIVVLISVLLCLGLVYPLELHASQGKLTSLYITGTIDYNKSYEMLEYVNNERKMRGLRELKMDASLLESAMVRAVETNVYFSHTRPSGDSCFSINSKAHGENIAAGNNTAESTFEQWKNSGGHYANMMDAKYNSIGVGCFSQGNVAYWVQIFSYSQTENSFKQENELRSFVVDTTEDLIDLSLNYNDNIPFFIGAEGQLSVRNANKGWNWHCVELDASMVDFSSSNGDIININKQGKFKTMKIGNAIISAQCLGKTLQLHFSGQYDRKHFDFSEDSVVLEQGASKKILANYTATGDVLNTELKWYSTNPNVASVDSQGNIKAIKPGFTQIKAIFKSNNVYFDTCDIIVEKPKESLVLNTSNAVLSVRNGFQIKGRLKLTNTEEKNITWVSSSPTIATVDSKGNVKAISPGYTYITGLSSNGLLAKCLVKVVAIDPSKVNMNISSANLRIGSIFKVLATVYPTNATDKKVTFSTTNSKVANVDVKGNVKAIGLGTAYIRAMSVNGKVGQIKVQVYPNPESISISPKSATVKVGAVFNATSSVSPSNAVKDVKYSSSTPVVASVDPSGKIKALHNGSTYITVTSHNGKTSRFLLRVV